MYFRNDVTVEGRLTEKPELKKNKNDKSYCFFTVCYNENRKVGDEWKSTPHFFRCNAWGSEADRVSQMEKGDAVSVIGRLIYSEWTDENNNKNSRVSIAAFHVRKFDIVKKDGTNETEESEASEVPAMSEDEAFDVFPS